MTVCLHVHSDKSLVAGNDARPIARGARLAVIVYRPNGIEKILR